MSKNSVRLFRARAALNAYRRALACEPDEADLRDCITDLLHLHAAMPKSQHDYDTEMTAMVALRAWKAEA